MKYLALLLLLIPLSLFGQVESQFNGTLNVFSASRIGSTNTFTISGIFSSTTSSYTSVNSAIGDIVQVQSGSRFYWLHIYSIASNSGGVITGNVRDSSSTLTTFPTGKWSIFRPTPNLRLPLSPDGETNASRSATFNTLALRVDELESNTGLQDGDKGDVRVTNSGATWTIDTGVVNSIKIAPQTVDSLDVKNRSITTVKIQDNAVTTAKIASAQISRSKLTQTLQDSLNRIRKDTSIIVGSGTTNYASLANRFARYNRVKIRCLLPTAGTANIILPTSSDTLKSTEFKVSLYAQDSVSGQINVTGFGGFAIYYDGTDIVTQEPNISLNNRETVTVNTVYHNSNYYWISEISKDWINEALNPGGGSGITALTGDVTASGTGSVTATIPTGTITSAKILDGTITTGDVANSAITTSLINDGAVTTAKLNDGAVTSLKVLDNSLTGSDLTYLTLRAGTSGNASLQLTSGTDKSTLTGGEIMYNGRFAVGIGSSKRRIATINDANATNGYLPIGNGTDFTSAPITAGTGLTVTNGSGSITIGETVAKVASVNMLDADVDISTQVNATLITHVNAYFTNGLYTITAPAPSSTLVGRMIVVNCSATAIGYGYLINTASGTSEFWGVNPASNPTNYAPAAFASDGWNSTLYTTVTYTCRQINGTYYWVRDHFFDPFLGQAWQDYKTGVTGTTLTFDTYVPDGAYVQEKLRVYKNGLFLNLGVDYTVTDNYPFVVVNLVAASISGDKWYFTYQY